METNQNACIASARKNVTKKVLFALCMVIALVAVSLTSVLATVAYLTSSAAVSNVFTIGNVGITMTELKVNLDGTPVDGTTRVDTNTYNLVPNKTYTKDPTIFVQANSEASYIFVLVRNDLEAIECKGDHTDGSEHKLTIAEQLEAKGWAKYTRASTGWVYVYVGFDGENKSLAPEDDDTRPSNVAYTYSGAGKAVTSGSYLLFEEFSIDEDADTSTYGAAKITLTAVAIQQAGFDTLADAWAAVVETYPYIHTGTNS